MIRRPHLTAAKTSAQPVLFHLLGSGLGGKVSVWVRVKSTVSARLRIRARVRIRARIGI